MLHLVVLVIGVIKKGVPLKSSPMICVSYVNIFIGYHSILNKCLKHNDSF